MISRIRSFCQKQTANARHQDDERDDDPRTELVEVLDEAQAILMPDRPQCRGHDRLLPGALGARTLGDDLAVDGRGVLVRAPQRSVGLAAGGRASSSPRAVVVIVVVVAGLAGDRVLELAHARAERPSETGQALRPEDHENDHQDDEQLWGADAIEHVQIPFRSSLRSVAAHTSVHLLNFIREWPILGAR